MLNKTDEVIQDLKEKLKLEVAREQDHALKQKLTLELKLRKDLEKNPTTFLTSAV